MLTLSLPLTLHLRPLIFEFLQLFLTVQFHLIHLILNDSNNQVYKQYCQLNILSDKNLHRTKDHSTSNAENHVKIFCTSRHQKKKKIHPFFNLYDLE